jgi:hypothetical protein
MPGLRTDYLRTNKFAAGGDKSYNLDNSGPAQRARPAATQGA